MINNAHRYIAVLLLSVIIGYAVVVYDPLTARDKIERAILNNNTSALSELLKEEKIDCTKDHSLEIEYLDPILILLIKEMSSDDQKRQRIVGLLISHCIGLNDKDQEGRTPLHWAMLKGSEWAVKELIRYGADVNVPDAQGRTAIFLAEAYAMRRADHFGNHLPEMRHIVDFLVENGADPNILDARGRCVAVDPGDIFSPDRLNDFKVLFFGEVGLRAELCGP